MEQVLRLMQLAVGRGDGGGGGGDESRRRRRRRGRGGRERGRKGAEKLILSCVRFFVVLLDKERKLGGALQFVFSVFLWEWLVLSRSLINGAGI